MEVIKILILFLLVLASHTLVNAVKSIKKGDLRDFFIFCLLIFVVIITLVFTGDH